LELRDGIIHKKKLKIPDRGEILSAIKPWIGPKKSAAQIEKFLIKKFGFPNFTLMGHGPLEAFLLSSGFVVVAEKNPNTKIKSYSMDIRPANIPSQDALISLIISWRNSATGLVIGTDDLADFLAKHFGCDFTLFGYGDLETFLTINRFTVVPVNKYLFFNPASSEKTPRKSDEKDNEEDDDDDDVMNDEKESDKQGENKESEKGESKGENEEDSDDGTCIVCMENERNCVILVCGHLGLCLECAGQYKLCPVCRKEYTREQVIKVFHV